jgi:two-component system sensor histidine kinase YesM
MLCILIATLFIKTIYSSLQRLRKAEQLTQAAEVRALQAHINPHFLLNTLDRMVGFVYSSEKKALITMIRSLANIFRYTTRANSILYGQSL